MNAAMNAAKSRFLFMTVVVSGAAKRCRWKFAQSQQSRLNFGCVFLWANDVDCRCAPHDDGKRLVVRADEKLSASLELEAAIGACQARPYKKIR
jgi:hypothetical protein